jgi:integrase
MVKSIFWRNGWIGLKPPHLVSLAEGWNRLRRYKNEALYHFVLYDFRHKFATRMADAGVDLATLAALLGHTSIRIVQR